MGIAMVHTCMDIGVRYPFALFMNIIRFPLLQKVLLGKVTSNSRLETEAVLAGCGHCFEPSLSCACQHFLLMQCLYHGLVQLPCRTTRQELLDSFSAAWNAESVSNSMLPAS